jgi:hypothetical protein
MGTRSFSPFTRSYVHPPNATIAGAIWAKLPYSVQLAGHQWVESKGLGRQCWSQWRKVWGGYRLRVACLLVREHQGEEEVTSLSPPTHPPFSPADRPDTPAPTCRFCSWAACGGMGSGSFRAEVLIASTCTINIVQALKLPPHAGVDFGESDEEAAGRELEEEAGMQGEVVEQVQHPFPTTYPRHPFPTYPSSLTSPSHPVLGTALLTRHA